MNTNLSVRLEPDGRVRLTGPCAVTGKEYSVVVTLEGVIAYFTLGTHITEAFPELPCEEREFLISGTSPKRWTRLFRDRRSGRDSQTQEE